MQTLEPKQSSKGDEIGSNVDSDYDSSLENSKSFSGDDGFRIEPIVYNNIDPHEPNNPTNANLNSTDTEYVPTKSPKKCPRENSEARRKKNKVSEDGRESVVALPSDESVILRVWDEDDEIVILKGIIDYAKNGGEPYVDAIGFIDSIKDSLHFYPSVKQVRYKIQMLKRKYDNISKRAMPDEDPVIVKPHELKSYKLWKQIWGREDGKGGAVAVSIWKKKQKSVVTEQKRVDLSQKSSLKESEGSNWSLHPCLNDLMHLDMDSTGECIVTEQTGLIERKKLLISELEAYLKWTEVVKRQAMQVLKALESSDVIGVFRGVSMR